MEQVSEAFDGSGLGRTRLKIVVSDFSLINLLKLSSERRPSTRTQKNVRYS